MPMSSGGHVASSSGCATRPKVREIGLTGCAVPTQRSLLIGSHVMATAEHREPCDSRGSCTVLGAPGGEIPPGDSTKADIAPCLDFVRFTPESGHRARRRACPLCANSDAYAPQQSGLSPDTMRSTIGFSETNRSVTRAARWAIPVPLQMLGVKFELAGRVYESVGHSQPRGRRADCISGVCVRADARRQGQMDRKDSQYTCGQGRALAERPWNLG